MGLVQIHAGHAFVHRMRSRRSGNWPARPGC
jgi:hypothetical protein